MMLSAAQHDLVQRHVPLAEKLARKHRRYGENLDDLRSDALLALTRAALRFDPARGVLFSTFACTAIEGGIKHGRRDRSLLPRSVYYTPDRQALAPDHQVPLSLDQAFRDDPDGTLLDGLAAPTVADPDDELDLATGLARLPARERRVLLLRQQGLPDREIGQVIGCSQVHASRIKRRALARLLEPPPEPEPEPVTLPHDRKGLPLSTRELEILRLTAAEGLARQQVAQRLGVADSTVRTHLHNASAKLGATNTLQAVMICLRAGWIALGPPAL